MFSRQRTSSVAEFCARYGIHRTTYDRRRADMPRTIKVGRQLRITEADEAEWLRRKQEAATTGRAA